MNEQVVRDSDFIFYRSEEGNIEVKVILDTDSETVWATQRTLAEVFGVSKSTVNEHLRNIFSENELNESATVRKFRTVRPEGNREVERELTFYNLNVILAVGYRVNSTRGTKFRQWATHILSEYLKKGFAMDDERLKQGETYFKKDYFSELLERIRAIRTSEKRFYEKIKAIYATSRDYDSKDALTLKFFKTVQNKLHFAVHGRTAAELIQERADAGKPQMGLTSWKRQKDGGDIQKSDARVAKNYLNEDEIKSLNRLVTMFLDYAEDMAEQRRAMEMKDWVQKVDDFLTFTGREVLTDAGRVSARDAHAHAEDQLDKYRQLTADFEEEEFEETVRDILATGRLPSESGKPEDDDRA